MAKLIINQRVKIVPYYKRQSLFIYIPSPLYSSGDYCDVMMLFEGRRKIEGRNRVSYVENKAAYIATNTEAGASTYVSTPRMRGLA
jgi:hypothetical protein